MFYKSRTQIIILTILQFLVLSSCSKNAGEGLFAEDCAYDNPNCRSPLVSLSTEGAKKDLPATAVYGNTEIAFTPIRSVRYGEETSFRFLFSNVSLNPLRSFSAGFPAGGSGFIFDSSAEDDCSKSTLLIYGSSCSATVSYTPGSLPSDQNIEFEFKTLVGDSFSIDTGVSDAEIISDFYVLDTELPHTLIYHPADPGYVEETITVYNYGSKQNIINMGYTLNGSSDFTLQAPGPGDCVAGQNLTINGGSCTLKLRFKPLSPGLKSTSITFTGTAGRESLVRSYTFIAQAKAITASSVSINFGMRHVNTAGITRTLSLIVPVTGDAAPASSCLYAYSGDAAIAMSSNSCLASQANGSSCSIGFEFTPHATDDVHHVGELSVICDSQGGSLTVPVEARSVTSPLLADPSSLNFGDVLLGSTSVKTINLTNTGDLGTLENLEPSIAFVTGESFSISETDCPADLGNGSCTVSVRYSPTVNLNSVGEFNVTSDQTALDPSLSLMARGISITASQSASDFGPVFPGTEQVGPTIYISNPSTSQTAQSCSIDDSLLSAQGFSLESSSTCLNLSNLAPGDSCSLVSRFTANQSISSRTARLSMTCAIGGTAQVDLRAQVVQDLRLVVLPSSQVQLSSRLVGIVDTVDYTLKNMDSSSPATDLTIETPSIASPWTLGSAGAEDCANFTNLNAGQSCIVRLQYAPGATFGAEQVGASSGRVKASAVSGEVEPENPLYAGQALKIESASSSYDFGAVVTGAAHTSTSSFVIQNPSSEDAASTCSLSISAPFEFTGQTCSTELSAGSFCSFQVRLPSQVGSAQLNGTAEMECAVGGRAQIALEAKVEKPPTLSWSGVGDFGDVDIGESKSLNFTLSHDGLALDASTSSLDLELLTGSSSQHSIASHDCPSILAPGASCTAVLVYTPISATTETATLNASDSDWAVSESINLTGRGIDTALRLVASPATVSFSDRLVGVVVQSDVTLSNSAVSGDAENLAIGSPSSGAPWSLGASGNPCGTSLPNGLTCDVRLVYAPTAAGSTSGTLNVSASNVANAEVISYTGEAEQLSGNRDSLDFGLVNINSTTIHASSVTISNPSGVDTASTCTYDATGPFSIVNSTCTATLNASATCVFDVQLSAPGTPANFAEEVLIACGVGGSITIPLTARVDDIPDVAWNGTPSSNFGEQDVIAGPLSKTFVFENRDADPVDVASVGFSISSGGFVITGGSCMSYPLTLDSMGGASDSCTVDVEFDPAADSTPGGETAAIRVTTATPVFDFDLDIQGIGTTMDLALSTEEVTFGVREVGQSGSETISVTLTNNGTRTAHLTYSNLTDPPFSLAGSCGPTLAQGGSCSLDLLAQADVSAGVHLETLTITETLNGNTRTKVITLNGETVEAPLLQVRDDRDQSTFTSIIALSDITGPVDDANNIVDLAPSSRDITFTLKNNVTAGSTLDSVVISLNHLSGAAGTMAIAGTNTCTGAVLAPGATCLFSVRYTPTLNSEASQYEVAISGTSQVTAVTYSAAVTSLVGNSIRGAQIEITQNDLSLTQVSNVSSATVTLANVGDQAATGLAYSVTGPQNALFALDTSIGSGCTASLAGGSTCLIQVNFQPGTLAGLVTSTLNVAGDQDGADITAELKGPSHDELILGSNQEGIESDISADSSRVYLVSRTSPAMIPLLKICSRTAVGSLNSAACTDNNLAVILGASDPSTSKLAGSTAGSGPRIVLGDNKILIAVQNEDASLGGSSDGTSTIIICQKPTTNNTVTDCDRFVLDTIDGSGKFPSLHIEAEKILLANTGAETSWPNGLVLQACDFDSASTTVSSTTLSSCVKQVFGFTDGGWYPSLKFNGSKVIVAAQDQSVTPAVLNLSACDVALDNQFSNCTTSTMDSDATYEYGFYPDLALSGSKLYVAHQVGSYIDPAAPLTARLSICDLEPTNSVSGCFSQDAISSVGQGAVPSLALGSDHLWMTTVKFDGGDPFNDARFVVSRCELPISAGTCSNISTHFFEQSQYSYNPIRDWRGNSTFFSRSLLLDETNKLLMVPFEATFNSYSQSLGIVNLGFIPGN